MRAIVVSNLVAVAIGALAGAYLYDMHTRANLAESMRQAAQKFERDLEAAKRAAKVEQDRAVKAAERRGTRAEIAQGIIYEAIADDASCEWSDSQRLRLERLLSTYSDRVSIAVPATAGDEPVQGRLGSGITSSVLGVPGVEERLR